VRTLKTFQGTHILGASRGLLCDSYAVLLAHRTATSVVGGLPPAIRRRGRYLFGSNSNDDDSNNRTFIKSQVVRKPSRSTMIATQTPFLIIIKTTNVNTTTLLDSTTRKPCYRKDDRVMHPMYKLFTQILFTLTATILCADFDSERI